MSIMSAIFIFKFVIFCEAKKITRENLTKIFYLSALKNFKQVAHIK